MVASSVIQDVFAQGTYVPRGTSAFGFISSISISEDARGIGLNTGYSIEGIVDLGLSISRSSIDNDFIDDLSGTSLGLGIAIHALKPMEGLPLSVTADLSIGRFFYSADVLDELNADFTGTGIGVGFTFAGHLPISEQTNFIPSLGVTYISLKAELEALGEKVSEDDEQVAFSIGFAFASRLPSHAVFLVGPNISVGENTTTFSISVGFVLDATPPDRRARRRQWPYDQSPPVTVERQPRRQPVEKAEVVLGHLSPEILDQIVVGIPQISTVGPDAMSKDQLKLIGQIFSIPPPSIRTFRWGTSLAPAGHPHAGTKWYRIQFGDGPREGLIRVKPDGSIVQRIIE